MHACEKHHLSLCRTATVWPHLIRAGCLVHTARIFILLLCLCLVGDAIGLVHGGDVVAERDGLHSLMYTAAHGAPDLSGDGGALLSWRVLGLLQGKEKEKVRS